MLHRKISLNKEIPRLIAIVDDRLGEPHGAYAALVYTWTIAHLDCDGRMHGDPLVVKSTVATRLGAVGPYHVEAYLLAAAELGLLHYYEIEGDRWIAYPAFTEHQKGIRKDRESPSTIPPPAAGKPINAPRTQLKFSPPPARASLPDQVPDLVPPNTMECNAKEILTPAHVKASATDPVGATGTDTPTPVEWGPGAFEDAWLAGTAMADRPLVPGHRHLWGPLCDRIAKAAALLKPPRAAFEYAVDLVAALPPLIGHMRQIGWATPAVRVDDFERHFERLEAWVRGEKPSGGNGNGRAGPPRTGPPPARHHETPEETDRKAVLRNGDGNNFVPPPPEAREALSKLLGKDWGLPGEDKGG